jgi:hypothetical protein
MSEWLQWLYLSFLQMKVPLVVLIDVSDDAQMDVLMDLPMVHWKSQLVVIMVVQWMIQQLYQKMYQWI